MIQEVIDLQNTNQQLQDELSEVRYELMEQQKENQKMIEYVSTIKRLEDDLSAMTSNVGALIIKQDALLDESIKIKKSSDALLKEFRAITVVSKQNKIRLALNIFKPNK